MHKQINSKHYSVYDYAWYTTNYLLSLHVLCFFFSKAVRMSALCIIITHLIVDFATVQQKRPRAERIT